MSYRDLYDINDSTLNSWNCAKTEVQGLNSSYKTKFETYEATLRIILPCQISPLHSDRLKTILVKPFPQIK